MKNNNITLAKKRLAGFMLEVRPHNYTRLQHELL
jgi:hypothetical protein